MHPRAAVTLADLAGRGRRSQLAGARVLAGTALPTVNLLSFWLGTFISPLKTFWTIAQIEPLWSGFSSMFPYGRVAVAASGLHKEKRHIAKKLSTLLTGGSYLFFYLVIISIPFSQRWVILEREVSLYQEFVGIILYLSDIPLFLTLSLWLASHIFDPSKKISLRPSYTTAPLLAILLFSFVSILWSTFPPVAAETVLRMLLLFGLYLFVVNEEVTPAKAMAALTLGTILQSAIALSQFFAQSSLGLSAIGELTVNPGVPNVSIVEADGRFWLRGYGLTSNPNILGGYAAVGLFAILGRYLGEDGRGRGFYLVLAAIATAGLIVTFSRSAWLGFAIGLSFLALLIRVRPKLRPILTSRLWKAGLVLGSVCLIFILLFPSLFVSRLILPLASRTGGQKVDAEHAEIRDLDQRAWEQDAALTLIRSNPLLGVGIGNFTLGVYQQIRNDRYVVQPVHNVPLLITAELGLIGGLLAMWVLAAPFLALLRRPDVFSRSFPLFVWSGALIALLTIGAFDYYPWASQYGRPLLWTTFGLWASVFIKGGDIYAKCS